METKTMTRGPSDLRQTIADYGVPKVELSDVS